MGDHSYLYKVINLETGKCYVGCTSNSVGKRWRQHLSVARQGKGSYLHAAIRKYGEQSFACVVLEIVRGSKDELFRLERTAISEHRSLVPDGYNLTPGGEGVDYSSPELRARHKIKLAESRAQNPSWVEQVENARQKALLVLHDKRVASDLRLNPLALEQLEKERAVWRASEVRRRQPGYRPELNLQSANTAKLKSRIENDATLQPAVLDRRLKDRARKKAPKKPLSPTWRLEALSRANLSTVIKVAERDAQLSTEELSRRSKQRAYSRVSRARKAKGVTAQQERDSQLPPEELARRLKTRVYDSARAKRGGQL